MSSNLDTLFVPVEVDALVINVEISGQGKPMATNFNLNTRTYSNLRDFTTPEPEPFSANFGKDGQPEKGIHLHWALPAGLRHGYDTEPNNPDSIQFPHLPNRWLLVRVTTTETNESSVKGWVLANDRWVDTNTPNSTPYIARDESKIFDNIQVRHIGQTFSLTEWVQQRGEQGLTPARPFLTALGLNDVTFTAYAPGARGTVSFHDDMAEVPNKSQQTYLVLGWYSESESDPLFGVPSAKDNLPVSGPIWEIDDGDPARKIVRPFQWSVLIGNEAPPTKTILQGTVYDVIWDTTNNNPASKNYPYKPQNYPDRVSENVNVAVGNTFAEALAVLIRQKAKDAGATATDAALEGKLLEAFQYNLLEKFDSIGGAARTSMEIHDRSFGKAAVNTYWVLADDSSPTTDRLSPIAPKLTPEQRQQLAALATASRQQLAALNRAQRQLDIARQRSRGLQWQLYAYWFQFYQFLAKNGGGLTDPSPLDHPDPANDNALGVALALLYKELVTNFDGEDSLPGRVRTQIQLVKNTNGDVETAKQTLEQTLQQIQTLTPDDKRRLKPTSIAPFWHPNDPVVLVTGLGRSDKFLPNDTLHCRRLTDLVTGLRVTYEGVPYLLSLARTDGSAATDRVKSIRDALPHFPTDFLPEGIGTLIEEGFVLDPVHSPSIARTAWNTTEETETAVTAIRQAIASTAPDTVVGTRPADFAAKLWEQPWIPLYLDWQTAYHFTYQKQGQHFKKDLVTGNYSINFTDWQFDRDDDYHWTGGAIDPDAVSSYQGRTFFTPAAHFTFMERLKQYVETHHDPNNPNDRLLENAEKLLEQLEQWDILSQSLGGLGSFLGLHDTRLHNAPPKQENDPTGYYNNPSLGLPKNFDTRLTPLLEDPLDPGSFPALEAGAPYDHPDQSQDYPPPVFFPSRAGYLEITKIRVTDTFGATQELIGANGNQTGNSISFQPILPDSLAADSQNPTRFIRLAPRVLQPSRLMFRYIDAGDDQKDTALEADASPICGWVLPNHIDVALSVYSAAGILLGEVIYTEPKVIWRPAPNNPREAPPIDPENRPSVDNGHLQNFLCQLITLSPHTFSAFIQTIDETLWTIDPLGVRDDRNLAVLIGRPLAIVRANLQLQLQGEPYADQCYAQMFTYDTQTEQYRLSPRDGGLSELSFPVKLGHPDLRDDGLIGYFQGTDYTKFNAIHKIDPLPQNQTFIQYIGDPIPGNGNTDRANYLYLKPTTEKPAPTPGTFDTTHSEYVTLLFDPRGHVHAITGILPVKILEFPGEWVESALEQMYVTFNIGPIIRDPEAARIPRPAETKGTWNWIQATGTETGNWQTDPANYEGETPRVSLETYSMQEGWLKFTPLNPQDLR